MEYLDKIFYFLDFFLFFLSHKIFTTLDEMKFQINPYYVIIKIRKGKRDEIRSGAIPNKRKKQLNGH